MLERLRPRPVPKIQESAYDSGILHGLALPSAKPNNVAMMPSPQAGANLPHSNATKLMLIAILAEFFCLRANDAAELLRGHMTPRVVSR